MRSVLLTISLMTALALSKPLDKRSYVTETDMFTINVTETADAEATGWGIWGGIWGTYSPSSHSVAAITTPTPAWTPATSIAPAANWSFAPATSSAASSSGSASSYAQAILDQHNIHRANHSPPALVWDDDMASIAQQIGQSCVYAHNTQAGGGGYGQNIGSGVAPNAVPVMITNQMYNDEIEFFPLPYGQAQPNMSNFESWGHFSQIVWQSSTNVGCATVDCSGGGLANTGSDIAPWFTVCNYKPPGNVEGEYGANIAQPMGDM